MSYQTEAWIFRGIVAISTIGLAMKYLSFNNNPHIINQNCIVKTKFCGGIYNENNDEIVEKIHYLKTHPKVKGVLLQIDSVGGHPVASEALYRAFKELSDVKPLIVSVKSCAASGGYMAILPADKIYAYETSDIGSIGCVAVYVSDAEALKKEGKEVHIYRSSPLKGGLSAYEKPSNIMTEYMQNSVNELAAIFKDLVRQERPKVINLELAGNGSVFNGRKALEIGLIDEIGTENDALKYLQNNYALENLNVIEMALQ